MADIARTVFGNIWASEGERIAPSTDKIDLGWLQEMMPYQWQNWLTERLDRHVAYLLQKGVPEYHDEQEYIAGKSYVSYQGAIYLATQNVTGVLPTSSASWKRISANSDNAGVVTVAGGGTGATSAVAARLNLGLGSIAVQPADGVAVTGGAISGVSINGAPIGATVPSTGRFTTVAATTFTGALSGNATTATTLAASRTIALTGGATGTPTVFNGSENIAIPVTSIDATVLTGVASVSTTGNAATATKLATARTINGVSFDGTQAITIADDTKLARTGGLLTGDLTITNGTTDMSLTLGSNGGRLVGSANSLTMFKDATKFIRLDLATGGVTNGVNTWTGNLTGNAATASKLASQRTINGTVFDGTMDVIVQSHQNVITSGMNVNSLTTVGYYVCETDAIAATLLNCPTIVAFSLLVERHSGVKQTLTERRVLTRSARTWVRSSNDGAFEAWREVVMNAGGRESATLIAAGTIEQRPLNPETGHFRLNSTTKVVEVYDGQQWGQVGTVSSQGIPTFTQKPITNNGAAIIVTTPHIRFMVWDGSKYIRAPWDQPGRVQYMYSNKTSITGYLPMRGDVTYNQADYPDLAEFLGLSGTGTFTLIETRGEFIRVLDNGRGIDVDRVNGSYQASQNLSHSHTATTDTQGHHTHNVRDPGHTHGFVGGGSSSNSTGAGSGTVNGAIEYPQTFLSGTGIWLDGNGGHVHNVTVGASGGSEARPRNVALSLWVSY